MLDIHLDCEGIMFLLFVAGACTGWGLGVLKGVC